MRIYFHISIYIICSVSKDMNNTNLIGFHDWLKILGEKQNREYERILRKLNYFNNTSTSYCKDLDSKLRHFYKKHRLTKKQKHVIKKIRQRIHDDIIKQNNLNMDVPCVIVVKDYAKYLRKLKKHNIYDSI